MILKITQQELIGKFLLILARAEEENSCHSVALHFSLIIWMPLSHSSAIKQFSTQNIWMGRGWRGSDGEIEKNWNSTLMAYHRWWMAVDRPWWWRRRSLRKSFPSVRYKNDSLRIIAFCSQLVNSSSSSTAHIVMTRKTMEKVFLVNTGAAERETSRFRLIRREKFIASAKLKRHNRSEGKRRKMKNRAINYAPDELFFLRLSTVSFFAGYACKFLRDRFRCSNKLWHTWIFSISFEPCQLEMEKLGQKLFRVDPFCF